MIESTYITYTQALSWAAFHDFEKLQILIDKNTTQKWGVDSPEQKACLLKGLKLMQSDKKFLSKAISKKNQALWNESTWSESTVIKSGEFEGRHEYGVVHPHALDIVNESNKTIELLISDLFEEIEEETAHKKLVDTAVEALLESFRNDDVKLYGKTANSDTHAIINSEVFISDNLYFYSLGNAFGNSGDINFFTHKGDRWSELKLKRAEILKMFQPQKIDTNLTKSNHAKSRWKLAFDEVQKGLKKSPVVSQGQTLKRLFDDSHISRGSTTKYISYKSSYSAAVKKYKFSTR